MNKTHKGLQVFLDDHGKFKRLAANKGMRMDMLFQEILGAYIAPRVKQKETPEAQG